VLIDESHRKWMLATLIALVIATVVYITSAGAATRPSGGSALGLAYGTIGFALMLFAGLLGARKRVRVWRVGKAQAWLRGHLWLGLLSFPLILFHGGFAFGGALTTALMILFIIVTASGIVGAALQHFLPRVMTTQVAMEMTYEEIPVVRSKLWAKAHELASGVCGPLPGGPPNAKSGSSGAKRPAAPASEVAEDAKTSLREFYLRAVRPFLEIPDAGEQSLDSASEAKAKFEQQRIIVSPVLHEVIDELEGICEEVRQLKRQVMLHRWLHGWLMVHIPISLALLILGAVHAVMALRY
jgi:hypothetical protein